MLLYKIMCTLYSIKTITSKIKVFKYIFYNRDPLVNKICINFEIELMSLIC